MTQATKTLTLLALLLTLPTLVTAAIDIDLYGNDRSFTTQATRANPTVCIGDTTRDAVSITNTGDYASTYQINTNLDEAQPGQQSTRLQPGQQTTIPIFIQQPFSANPSQQEYTVDITDSYNKTQRIQRTLTTNRCQSLQAELYRQTPQTINPCQPINYKIRLENPAPFSETYTITANDRGIRRLTLDPGAEQTLNTTVQYACSTYGNVTTDFRITADNNDVQTHLPDDLTIRQNYPYTVSEATLKPNQPTCTDETLRATYTITNNAPFNNTYTVATDLQTNTDQVTLEPDESTTITASTTSTTPTTINEPITFTSERGDITKTRTVNTSFTDCYNATTSTTDTSTYYCAGQNHYPLTITNDNQFQTTYTTNITTTTNNATFNTPTSTQLSPGEQRTIHIPFTADPLGIETTTITTQTTYQHRSGQTTELTTTQDIRLHDTYQCTKADTPRQTTAYYDDTLTVPITNNGIHTATYDATTNTSTYTPWQNNLTIPGGGNTKYLVLNHDYNQTTTRTDKVELTLKNTANGYEYTNNITITLSPEPWWHTLTTYINDSTCAQITTALLILILLALAAAPRIAISPTLTTTLNAAAIIAAIIAISIAGLPPLLEPSSTVQAEPNGITATLPANTTTTINLDDYFQDPDNDAITYTTTSVANLTTTINNETLTLSGDPGTYQTRITASDQNNATTTTALSTTITEPRSTTTKGIYGANCTYLNWALLILLILIIASRTKTATIIKRRRDNPFDDEPTPPTEDNTVDEIQGWLDEHNMDYTTKMRKNELLDLVDEHTDDE
jgi:hypothetical protein